MSLPHHPRLGLYEIIAPMSAGGMGEVFRARDTRLSRNGRGLLVEREVLDTDLWLIGRP